MKNFIIWTLNKYFWDNKIKKGEWAGHVVCLESAITEYEFLGGEKVLGSHECVQKYYTKMYLKEMEKKWKVVDWIYLAQVGGLW